VYRYSDRYPASALRDLVQLNDLLNATRDERGPAYTAATFVFLNKLSTIDLYLDGDPERTIGEQAVDDVRVFQRPKCDRTRKLITFGSRREVWMT